MDYVYGDCANRSICCCYSFYGEAFLFISDIFIMWDRDWDGITLLRCINNRWFCNECPRDYDVYLQCDAIHRRSSEGTSSCFVEEARYILDGKHIYSYRFDRRNPRLQK